MVPSYALYQFPVATTLETASRLVVTVCSDYYTGRYTIMFEEQSKTRLHTIWRQNLSYVPSMLAGPLFDGVLLVVEYTYLVLAARPRITIR